MLPRLLNTPPSFFISWSQGDRITLWLLAILVLATLLFSLHRRKYTLLLRSLYSPRYFTQLSHEGKIFKERTFLLDAAGILLTQSLFLCLLSQIFIPHIHALIPPRLLLPASLCLALAYALFEVCMTFIFTFLYDLKEEREAFFSYRLFYHSVNNMVLFPLLILAIYTPCYDLLLVYIPILFVNSLVLIYRLFHLIAKKINPFHFFIYFCTFEILPCLLSVKMLFLIDNQIV